MEKNIKVDVKANKALKRAIKKQHRFNLSKTTQNIYLQRITRKQWIKISIRNMFLVFLALTALIFVITSTISNVVGYYLIENNHIAFNYLFLFIPYLNAASLAISITIPILLSLLLTLLFFKNFIKKATKKTNWVESEESGSAHFLTDERNPWTIKPQIEAQYYPKTYFLDKGDWIIRLNDTYDYDEFLNQANKMFVYKAPDGKDINDILKQIKVPIGYYQEEVKYTSANDVLTDIKNISNGKIFNSPQEFKNKVKAFLMSKKLKCILIQTAGDSANAYVLGATGSGKTTKLNIPTILANANAIQQPSLFISDPKGELYNNLSGYLTARGYEPYSLDLFDLIRSMGWNPLQDVYQKFLAKGILKQYLKQYEQARVFFNLKLKEQKSDDENEESVDINEILNKELEILRKELEDKIEDRNAIRDLIKEYDLKNVSVKDPMAIIDEVINIESKNKLYELERKYASNFITEWKDEPIIDEKVNMAYPILNDKEYYAIKKRLETLNITSLKSFVFDESEINNPFILQTPHLQMRFVDDNDKATLSKYVCSIHTGLKANEKCICDDSDDRIKFILFDNYIFKTHNALSTHFSSTLNTQISEQIRVIQNAIFYTDKQDHWISSASKIFSGIIYNLGYKVEDNVNSIPIEKFNIFSLVSLTKNQAIFNEENFFNEKIELTKQLARLKNSDKQETYDVALKKYRLLELETRADTIALSSIFNSADEEGKSIISTFDTKMNPFLTDGVKLLTSFNDITFEKLIQGAKPKAIFVGINVNDPTYYPFITLFISTLHQKLSEKAKKSGGKLDRYFMFMLDEFGNIPAIPNYGKILSTCRSENIKFMSIVQSNAQIEKNYEKDKDTIITNKGLNIYLKSGDEKTAEYYSKVLGQTTIDVSKTQSARDKGWITDKKDFKQRSLMNPDEIMKLDYEYYHDTLFISNSKAMLVQVKPWYRIFNTKDFTLYRPIQYKLNQYSISVNQLKYDDVKWDANYILDFYTIKDEKVIKQNNNNAVEKQINDNKILIEKQKEVFKEKTKILDDKLEENEIYVFSDLLINTYDLTFDNKSGISRDELNHTLLSFGKEVNKTLLFQNWNSFEMTHFTCSRSDFQKELNDYLAAIGDIDTISKNQVLNFEYIFDNSSINGLLILLAKQLLNNEITMNEINIKYPQLSDLSNNLELFINDIIIYELTQFIKQTENNYEIKLYEFLTRYRDFENDDITTINALFKALVSLVDKQIYINLNKTFTMFNPLELKLNFKLYDANEKHIKIFIENYNATHKKKILLDDYWNNQVLKLIDDNKDNIEKFIN